MKQPANVDDHIVFVPDYGRLVTEELDPANVGSRTTFFVYVGHRQGKHIAHINTENNYDFIVASGAKDPYRPGTLFWPNAEWHYTTNSELLLLRALGAKNTRELIDWRNQVLNIKGLHDIESRRLRELLP